MKQKQREFYDVRFSLLKRGMVKHKCLPIVFYDVKLIESMLRTLGTYSIDSLLEVGCGQGTDALLISKYAKSVIAIDISRNALKVAKTLSILNNCRNKILFVVADADHLPFQEGNFDVVFCKDLLHHVPDPVLTLSEMRRAAKVNGRVAAIEANACNPQMIMIGLIYFRVDKGVFHNTAPRLIKIFKAAGLSNVKLEKTELMPRHLLFEYRSPLCLPMLSESELTLRILKKIEDKLQSFSFLKNFSNYIIIGGLKDISESSRSLT
jgi:ubiquinone/menaquinone biosynthesis C-methylase UbiE